MPSAEGLQFERTLRMELRSESNKKNNYFALESGAAAGKAVGAAAKARISKDKKLALAPNLEALNVWLEEKLRVGQVPRVSDLLEASKRGGWSLGRSALIKQLQSNPVYMFNMHQQKKKLGSRKFRPVVSTSLGYLHCDIGFFSKSRHYLTPPTFQTGFLAARDVLSRFVYLVVLRKSRKGASMISAFETLLALHSAAGHAHPVRGISFDRERSVVSREVQEFLQKRHIKFTAFKMSSSKAKHAESLIGQVRTDVARLERFRQLEFYRMRKTRKADRAGMGSAARWWNLLGDVATGLNDKEIVVGGKRTGFKPRDVSDSNLPEFLTALYKAVPAYYAAQFQVSPRFVNFRYSVGTHVRAKLISTSSAVLGIKHSETSLEDPIYRILTAIPYVTRKLTLGKSYKCVKVNSGEQEVFDENDIVPTNPDPLFTADRHRPLETATFL